MDLNTFVAAAAAGGFNKNRKCHIRECCATNKHPAGLFWQADCAWLQSNMETLRRELANKLWARQISTPPEQQPGDSHTRNTTQEAPATTLRPRARQ